MAEQKKIRLRTPADVVEASEWLYNEQREGKIDGKRADGINTTLKSVWNIVGKTRMDMLKIYVQSQIKKVDIPPAMLIDLTQLPGIEDYPKK